MSRGWPNPAKCWLESMAATTLSFPNTSRDVVEHPKLVAQRIVRFANLVGRENVIVSTDCGLGGRMHPQIAWAKLESLAQGAALATQQLWQ